MPLGDQLEKPRRNRLDQHAVPPPIQPPCRLENVPAPRHLRQQRLADALMKQLYVLRMVPIAVAPVAGLLPDTACRDVWAILRPFLVTVPMQRRPSASVARRTLNSFHRRSGPLVSRAYQSSDQSSVHPPIPRRPMPTFLTDQRFHGWHLGRRNRRFPVCCWRVEKRFPASRKIRP